MHSYRSPHVKEAYHHHQYLRWTYVHLRTVELSWGPWVASFSPVQLSEFLALARIQPSSNDHHLHTRGHRQIALVATSLLVSRLLDDMESTGMSPLETLSEL